MEPSQYTLTKSNAEKLEDLFSQKALQKIGESFHDRKYQEWIDYLDGMDGVKHIRKFSNLAESTDYLIDEIQNNLPFNNFILRDRAYREAYIIVEREVAEKILILGMLP